MSHNRDLSAAAAQIGFHSSNIGIGTDVPSAKLEVKSTGATAVFNSGAANDGRLEFEYNSSRVGLLAYHSDRLEIQTDSSKDFTIRTNGANERLRINSNSQLLHTRTDNVQRYDLEFRQTGGISDGNYGGIHWSQGSTGSTNLGAIEINYADTGRPDIVFKTRQSGGTAMSEAARIDSVGRFRIANQPAFSVQRNGNQSISHNTNTKVQWNTEIFDVGGNFDSSTNYRFTAPVAGKYLFMGHLYVYWTYQVEARIYKNGSTYKRFSGPLGSGGNDNPNGIDFMDIIDLSVNDFIEIFAYQYRTGDTATQNIYGGNEKETSFVGYLLG